MRIKQLVRSFLVCAGPAAAQFILQGIVDLHAHANPDSAPPRRTDSFEIAQAFRKEDIRAYVIRSHFLPTSQLAYAVDKVIPEVCAYGGIALNRSVGGIAHPGRGERSTEADGQAGIRAGFKGWRCCRK